MQEEQNQQGQQLNIELSEEMADGIYSNLVIIGHSTSEFVYDFVRIMPNAPKAKVKSRIVMTPQHAKRFMNALIENIKRYEAQFGVIQHEEQVNTINFSGTTGEA